jgi:phospholipid/cholesterol/gamma-HCH transport system substrate-binding protein
MVIAIAVCFFMFAYGGQKSDDGSDHYMVMAKFQSVDGIIDGSDVMIAGINVGSVSDLKLDPVSFMAIVTMKIDKKIKLSTDSQASVVSNGFLGGKFISITPGIDETILNEMDTMVYTQSSVNLESLIGKFMYSAPSKQK